MLLTPADWLSQFLRVRDDELTSKQLQFVMSLREQFPSGNAGLRKDGSMHFYAVQNGQTFTGPICADSR